MSLCCDTQQGLHKMASLRQVRFGLWSTVQPGPSNSSFNLQSTQIWAQKKKTSNRRVGVCETNEKTDWQEAPYILRAWTSHFQQLSFLRAGTVSVFFTTVYTPCPAQGLVCNHTTKEWKKCFFLQAGVSFGDKPKEFAGSQELAPNSRTKTNLSTKYLEPIYSRAQPCWSVSVKSAVH